jgi:hypothetical protein
MFTKEAIEQIQESSQHLDVKTLNGIDYLITPKSMDIMRQGPATPNVLTIHTLGGIVEYLKNSNSAEELWEKGIESKYLIHIEDYYTVRVVSPLEPTHMVRRQYICAAARANEFKLETYMSTERFIISVMASFAPTENRNQLLEFVSQIRSDNSREETDRGVSQTVTVQKTIATLGHADVPNPVELQPYVTFPEITQPLRSYVFRIKQQKSDDPIQCGLFPIESSVWEAITCEQIRNYFEEKGNEHDLQAIIIS